MLVKLGVDISRLKRNIRRALKPIDTVYHHFGEEAVITSTYEGDHDPSTLHYSDEAIDVRLLSKKEDIPKIIVQLVACLGKHYDIVKSKNCIHIEYDKKD